MIRRPPRSTLFPYTDALPIWVAALRAGGGALRRITLLRSRLRAATPVARAVRLPISAPTPVRRVVRVVSSLGRGRVHGRSEEHTSELQSRQYLVCRLLLEKKR